MLNFLEQFVTSIWNRLKRRQSEKEISGVVLGVQVIEGDISQRTLRLSSNRRTMHIAILGKTGSGKSSLLRSMAKQDIEAGRGLIYFDLHGDAVPFLLGIIAKYEKTSEQQLHEKLIYIAPADKEYSIGLNPLEQREPSFVRTAEFTQLLMERWGLARFGARTDELLRNALYVLSANGLTLLELAPLLTNQGFRAACLKNTPNAEVRQYFESRYNKVSEPMQATMREPILNKTSAFTADPQFRHIIGQRVSTFSMSDAMDEGHWIIVNLEKGKLGEQSLTLGSLLFTAMKNALFSRTKRTLFTIYVDELQNFVAHDVGIETVLSEARKFGISIVSANQFLGQYPDSMREAILSIGTHVFFNLSPVDAAHIATALDGGKSLAERLKNLPQQHFVVKSSADHWKEGQTLTVEDLEIHSDDLVSRARAHHGRSRVEVEREIMERHKAIPQYDDNALDGWE